MSAVLGPVRRTRPRPVLSPSHCRSTTCPPYSAPSCPGTKPLRVYHASAVLGPVLSRHQATAGLPRVRRTRPRPVLSPSHCRSTTRPPYSAPSCPGTKPLRVYHASAVLSPVPSCHQATAGLPRVRRTQPRPVLSPSHCRSTTRPLYSAPSRLVTKPLQVYYASAVLSPVPSCHQATAGLPRVRRTQPRPVLSPSHCRSTMRPPYLAPSRLVTKPLRVYHVSTVLGPVQSCHQATAGLPRVHRTRPRPVLSPSHCRSTTRLPYSAPSRLVTKPLPVYHVATCLPLSSVAAVSPWHLFA